MQSVFIINAHHYYPFSEGKLNATLVTQAKANLSQKGYQILESDMTQTHDLDAEIEKHRQADYLLIQSPVNWMGFSWRFKQYMDEVYTAGMDGRLCHGDGRSRETPEKHYGSGGRLKDKKYMLSLTFNAPEGAFNDRGQYLFQGKSVDDLLFPMHMNFRFFGMQALPSFACFDVMKNPDINNDLRKFESHLNTHF